MPTIVREAWTDERLDDLTKHMAEGFREVRVDLREQRERIDKVMVKQERMDAKFEAIMRALQIVMRALQIGFSLIGVLLAALLGLVGTQL
ncbi:MAG TPA: hypothetical protein VF030_06555 [Solirubrobacterales bacterium]